MHYSLYIQIRKYKEFSKIRLVVITEYSNTKITIYLSPDVLVCLMYVQTYVIRPEKTTYTKYTYSYYGV